MLNKGDIAQHDTPHKVYEEPNSKTVASLFWLANFFTEDEAKTVLNIDVKNKVKVENEYLIRPHQLTSDNIKAEYKVMSELFLGYSTIQKIETSEKQIWITKT